MRIVTTLLLSVSAAVTAADAPHRFNVLFILADDLRPDALHVTGNTQIVTPNLDKLAGRGCRFTRATCGYPICHVARSEILSGRCLIKEATAGKAVHFEKDWTLWPEVMQRAGWHTVYSGKWHVEGSPWTRGYDETSALFSSGGGAGVTATLPVSATGRKVTGYTGWTFKTNDNKPLPDLGVGLTPETDAHIADGVIAAIRAKHGKSLFLHVNFTAPHDPPHWPAGFADRIAAANLKLPRNFAPQPAFDHGNIHGRDEMIVPAPRTEEDVMKERAVYFTLVENVDKQVGRIVAALDEAGGLADTLIIFSSDQGLAIGSHGLMGKQNSYEHTINVPLIIAGPGVPAGKLITAQCYLRDLYPTVCDMAGIAIPPSVEGRSLLPVIRCEKAEVYDDIFGYFTDTQRMIRSSDGWKLIHYPKIGKSQLFHVTTDPDELTDLSGDPSQRGRRDRMTNQLDAWRKTRSDPALWLSR